MRNIMKMLTVLGGGGGVVPVPPPIITNLQIDYDSRGGLFTTSAGSTPAVAGGDPIGRWVDQSGNGRNITQGTAGARPTLRLNEFNGLPGIEFDGTDDRLVSAAALSTIITASAYSLYVVCKVDAVNTNAANTYDNDAVIADQAGGFWGLHLKSAPTAHVYNWDGSDDQANVAIATGTAMLLHTRHDSGNIYISRDGGAESSVASGDTLTLTNVFAVGRNIGTAFFDGMVARVLCYNVAHSVADKNTLIAHLKSVYGIA